MRAGPERDTTTFSHRSDAFLPEVEFPARTQSLVRATCEAASHHPTVTTGPLLRAKKTPVENSTGV